MVILPDRATERLEFFEEALIATPREDFPEEYWRESTIYLLGLVDGLCASIPDPDLPAYTETEEDEEKQ